MITASGAVLIAAKATLLFTAGLAAVRLTRRGTAAVRHRICVAVLGAALAVPLTLLIATPAVVVHVPRIAALNPALRMPPGGDARQIPWGSLLAALWASGCAVVVLRFGAGCVALARVRRSAIQEDSRSGVPILSAEVSVPMLAGLVRPAILLPRSAGAWPEPQREAAIRHELTHLRRGDLWTNLVSTAACGMYWFHPLSWMLARKMREEQENACDDAVIAGGFDCAEYAQALVETARNAVGFPLVSCRMTDGASVKQRVARILLAHGGPSRRSRGAGRAAMALVLLAAGVACTTGEERVYTATGGISQPVLIHKVNPAYTADARARKIQGNLWLSLVVGADGSVREVVVVQGIDPGLDRSAAEAIRQWRFRPAQRGGKPVAVAARTMVRFRLA